MPDIVLSVPCVTALSPNHGDRRSRTLGGVYHATHSSLARRAGESLEDWCQREYLNMKRALLRTKAEGNKAQVSPTFLIGPREVCRMIPDDLDPWCQQYPDNDTHWAVEMAKPYPAVQAGEGWPEFYYVAGGEIAARMSDKYGTPLRWVDDELLPGLVRHRDTRQGERDRKVDPDGKFDRQRLLAEAAKVMARLHPPEGGEEDPAYQFVGPGLRAYLLAHRDTLGKPRFPSTYSQGGELAWLEASAAYPDGPGILWRKWIADMGPGHNPVRIVTWKEEL